MVVKRSHTAENVAPAVRTLRDQVNAAYPNRLKTTVGHDADGIWPSAAHTAQNPNSDHEAGNAIDIDDDLSGTQQPPQVTPLMARVLSLHPACNYAIHDNVIYRVGKGYPYTGSSPHTGHVHVSVYESRRGDTSRWAIGEEAEVLDYFIIPVICETPEALAAAKAECAALGIKQVPCGNALYAHCNKDKGEQLQTWVKATSGVGSLKGVPTTKDTAAAMGLVKDARMPSCDAVAADLAKAQDKINKARAALA